VWLDEAEMLVGDSLIDKIREGIDAMDYVGAVISRHSIASEWVRRELDVAMNQEIQGRRVKVLPLLIDDCELPGFLMGKLFADFRDEKGYIHALEQIIKRLGNVDGWAGTAAEGIALGRATPENENASTTTTTHYRSYYGVSYDLMGSAAKDIVIALWALISWPWKK
jgi:hypothetical protein